jgi:hypothetical protein
MVVIVTVTVSALGVGQAQVEEDVFEEGVTGATGVLLLEEVVQGGETGATGVLLLEEVVHGYDEEFDQFVGALDELGGMVVVLFELKELQ